MKILSFTVISAFMVSSSLFGVTLSPSSTNNSLIIYNSNIGLVHEQRELTLEKDETQIIYEDVASSINTDSVNVNLPSEISLQSQQYKFDKLTQRKLLDAHIGKMIDVRVEDNAKNYKTVQAELLSNDGMNSIVRTDDKIIISVVNKNIIFKSIPEELITKPSLVWNVTAQEDVNAQMSIDYLINNISWKSNYILNLKEDKADLTGWINIDNRSGKSFENTNLHVLAGDINRATNPRINYRVAKSMAIMDAASVSHQAHEGYHFYTIPFKANIANNEKTQVKFISQTNLHVERKYTSRMSNPNHLKGERKHSVLQLIELKSLNIPLPQGVVRTYLKYKNTKILLGETRVKHTPSKTPLSFKVGKNFDVKVKETLEKFDDGKWSTNVDVLYTLKNSSQETKIVEILVPFNKNDGSKVKSSQEFTYTQGNLVTFHIEVKANKSKEFKVHFKTKK